MSPPSDRVDEDDPGQDLRSSHVAPDSRQADVISVLLVEDDDVDAKLIDFHVAGLTNPRVVVERAVSVSEARTLLTEYTFDLCILDFWLGCESSLRLLAELDGNEAALPTIMLTSLSTPDIGRMCRRTGASLFIGKEGLGPASLQAAIHAALGTKAARPPTDSDASTTGRSPTDDRRTGAVPTSADTPDFGVAETREDAMVRVLAGMVGVSDDIGESNAARAPAGRGRQGGRAPGRDFHGHAVFDRAQVGNSGGSHRDHTVPHRASLLAALPDMTETVRFGLFEKVLTTRRPGAPIQTGKRIEDAGDFIASAVAIARGALDDRGQTVSLHRPGGVVAVPCDPATFLFIMFELVLRASQQTAGNSHVDIWLHAGASALHVSLVSGRPAHAHASALAFGPLFRQILGGCRGTVSTASGDDGPLRLDCHLDADTTADEAGGAGHELMAWNLSGWTPLERAPHHHPPDAG